MIFFDTRVELLDDILLKLSCVGCLHGLFVVEVVHVVDCN